MICFVLLLGGISALYLVTSVRQLHGGRWGHAGPSDLRDFLDSDERQKMEREKREYIQQMKQKLAKQQVGDIVVRIKKLFPVIAVIKIYIEYRKCAPFPAFLFYFLAYLKLGFFFNCRKRTKK